MRRGITCVQAMDRRTAMFEHIKSLLIMFAVLVGLLAVRYAMFLPAVQSN